ncbi:unnamed protein product [Effrenium voratum]|nr:unnamed protein product [Effrenium voratum]
MAEDRVEDLQAAEHLELADFFSSMELARPEVLRDAAAYKVFQSCSEVLREGGGEASFAKSQVTDRIQEFWSHSWHSSAWKKVLTLLVLNNGPAAIALGTFCALLGACLFLLNGQAPGFMCPVLGVAGAGFTLAFWRSRKRIFLDAMCISQTDDELKTQAIRSLAGILNKSDSMLVLWDESFADRLWCIFELAAFLKSQESQAKALPIICPTLAGPISVGLFAMAVVAAGFRTILLGMKDEHWALSLLGTLLILVSYFLIIAHVGRGFYRSIEAMQRKLLSLRVAETECNCCKVGHVDVEGEQLLCDRVVIYDCIARWFGSIEEFEEFIHTKVVDEITRGIERTKFSDAWAVAMATPTYWAMIDCAFAMLALAGVPTWQQLLWWVLQVLGIICFFPVLTAWNKFLAHSFRRPGWTKNLLILLCNLPITFARLAADAISLRYEAHLEQAAAFAVIMGPSLALMWSLRAWHGCHWLSQCLVQYRLSLARDCAKAVGSDDALDHRLPKLEVIAEVIGNGEVSRVARKI